MMSPSPFLRLLILLAAAACAAAGEGCSTGCDLAVASYYISQNQNLTYIASLFGIADYRGLAAYNAGYPNPNFIPAGVHILVNFTCRCLALPGAQLSTYLAGSFPYKVSPGDTYSSIAAQYSNLTTATWLQTTNIYPPDRIPVTGTVNVTVNCSCGDPAVSPDRRVFLTYPPGDGESIVSVGSKFGFLLQSEMDLLRRYNPGTGTEGVTGTRLVYVPLREGFNRVLITGSASSRGTDGARKIKVVVAAGVSGLFGLCIIVLALFMCYKTYYHMMPWQRGSRNVPRIESFLQKQGTSHPKRYTYSDVRRMSKSFTHKLGQGGYGAVYRGNLTDGREIAVKLLKDTEGEGEEFMNEVASISRTSHVNVVNLLGFCLQGSRRALIYEYMPNGSLERYTFGNYSNDRDETLTWDRLFDIVIGIARGLEYLHTGCNTRIVHFDIKPQNILLDQDFCPKIADFGLAKLCQQKESKISIAGARGTIGYIAPEVFSRNYGSVSTKSDVYSYGMVVLEMVGARKQIDVSTENSSKYFPQWLYDNMDQVYGSNGEITNDAGELVKKMIIIALWCIQFTPADRPSMSKVLDMLESNTVDLQLPPKAF